MLFLACFSNLKNTGSSDKALVYDKISIMFHEENKTWSFKRKKVLVQLTPSSAQIFPEYDFNDL